jgi:hypothetical protein
MSERSFHLTVSTQGDRNGCEAEESHDRTALSGAKVGSLSWGLVGLRVNE